MILLDIDSPLATVTLNRPERHNSLVPELLEQLLDALAQVAARPDVWALVLQANGRSFSTGGDLRGFVENLDDLERYAGRLVGLLNETVTALIDLPVPVVAAVHGIVTGGSLGLVLASDVVLVTAQASFSPFYSVVGFSPDGGWTTLLPDVIGRKRTAELLLTNGTITAEQAVAWGLASRLVAADDLHSEASETGLAIAAMRPGAVRAIKRRLWADVPVAQRLEAERRSFVEQIVTAEAQAGMAAFLDGMRGNGSRRAEPWPA
ncbi:MAG: enoyl-CoA hydratase/isomerase family protein [Caldilineales bacterium]